MKNTGISMAIVVLLVLLGSAMAAAQSPQPPEQERLDTILDLDTAVRIVGEDERPPLRPGQTQAEWWTHRYLENHYTDYGATVTVKRVESPCPPLSLDQKITRSTFDADVRAGNRVRLRHCTQANHRVIGGNFCIKCTIVGEPLLRLIIADSAPD